MRGWEFSIQWKDGKDSRVTLKRPKVSHPLQVAEYAQVAENINEPALAWWEPIVLNKRDRIIAKDVSISKKKNHKYGIDVPRDERSMLELDWQNSNSLLTEAIEKKKTKVIVVFDT